MKKIIPIILMALISTAFAGNIYSNDNSVNYYIKVNEVEQEQYQFEVCDKFENCQVLGKGFVYSEKIVKKLIRRFKRTRTFLVIADPFVGVGTLAGSTVLTAGVFAMLGSLLGDGGQIGGVVLGAVAGIVIGIAADIALLTGPLNPATYGKLSKALEQALNKDTTIKRKDILALAELIDKILLKYA